MTADALITKLGLMPHPEGGHYRQTWAAAASDGTRPSATCIYFLLKAGESSHWHKVDAAELWLWHAGAPLTLRRAPGDEGPASETTLGPDLASGQHPQLVVEKDHWQAAASQGDWSLVSCVVSPGFQFEGFTLAAPGFDIPG
ncbi:cupin domain-containing protein [Roseobacteraceae bacterium S113]